MDVRAVSSQALEIAGGIRVFSKFFFSWWEANSNNSKKLGEKKRNTLDLPVSLLSSCIRTVGRNDVTNMWTATNC